MTHRLVARLDNAGDVLLAGPAVRSIAASGSPVTFLAGPAGAAAARMLPGVDDVLCYDAAWIAYRPSAHDQAATDQLIADVRGREIDEAVILTSFHQSPLPLALILRMAGVRHIAATCVDYPGSLLDVRHPYIDELHEVEQSLSLAAAAGHQPAPGDDGRLAVRLGPLDVDLPPEPYVVVHPAASVPSRGLPVDPTRTLVGRLLDSGRHVVITGSASERVAPAVSALTLMPPSSGRATVHDRVGTTTLRQLGHLVAGAEAVVCGNTGVAHLAAAVGTAVVEAFAPVVPAHRWRPWCVPHVLLGRLDIACAGCRCRTCPVDGQPCLDPFTADAVMAALALLAADDVRSADREPVAS
jgi:ADP-heptose:LPS heptosyltransferase